MTQALREKCPNTELFLSVFSCIRTEYREILSISPYSARMRENKDQKKLRIRTLFKQWRYSYLHCVTAEWNKISENQIKYIDKK